MTSAGPDAPPRPAAPVVTAPRIAVVILTHDYARFLAGAVRSALAQTRPADRVVVVDDGSTDGTAAVLASLPADVTVIRKANGGQASAVNAGARACPEADLVLFLDADDVLEPDALEAVAQAVAHLPAPGRVHWPMRVIDNAGVPTGEVRPAPPVRLPAGDLRRPTVDHPFDGPWAAMSGNAFGAAALRALLPLPEGARVGADWLLVHGSSLHGPVAAVHRPLTRYRVHGANAYGGDVDRLHLPALRATIGHAAAARDLLAAQLAAGGAPVAPLRSFADSGNRLLSLRLDPAAHPVPGDTRPRLLATALLALRRRRDLTPVRRLVLAGWVVVVTLAPRSAVPTLGTWFIAPHGRPSARALAAGIAARLRPRPRRPA